MKNQSFLRSQIAFYIFAFLAMWLLYTIIAFFTYSDLMTHAQIARQVNNKELPMPGNFILYFLINCLSFFSTIKTVTKIAIAFLVASAIIYRLYIVNKDVSTIYPAKNSLSSITNLVLSLSLLFVFAIYNPFSDWQYLGRFVPNVWHNSTTIFLFPFAVLLFNLSCKQLEAFDAKRNKYILLLIFLNIFIKPSFFFVWICVYPLFLLVRYKFSKDFWLSLIPAFIGGILLLLQYLYIYHSSTSDSSVIIAPFFAYRYHLNKIIFYLFISFLFPILYFAFNSKKILKDKSFLMSYCLLIVSLLIFFLFAESGARIKDGNFYWQVVICTWIVFYKSFLALLKDIKYKTAIQYILITVYALHVVSGIAYLVKFLIKNSYC